ncbi:hypothetical protein GCM10020254_58360 [Streptomyces goshikiensis]
MLHDGRIAADGPPAEVFDDGLLSRVYRQPVEVLPHPRTGGAAGGPGARLDLRLTFFMGSS